MAIKLKKPVKKQIALKLKNGDKRGALKIASKAAKLPENNTTDMPPLADFLKRKVIKGGPEKRVAFKVMGGRVVKKAFFRKFDTVKDAATYFAEFVNKRVYNLSSDGTVCTFVGSVDSVISNMDLRLVIARKPIPKEGLPALNGFQDSLIVMPSYAVPGTQDTLHGEAGKAARPATSSMKSRARDTGDLIPLKVICADNSIEPRIARMKLRKAVKDAKKYPALHASHNANARWEWPKGSTALDDVLKAIKGA